MKLFLYEHITSGALIEQPLPTSLASEGDAMLLAVLADSLALAGHSITIMRDTRLAEPQLTEINSTFNCHLISTQADYNQLWSTCIEQNDAILIIAPETANCLLHLQQYAIDQGKVVLGCSVQAIALTGNKMACHDRLLQADINTAYSCVADNWSKQKFVSDSGYIIKPIDGAGCLDTLFFETANQLEHYLAQLSPQTLAKTLIQPYLKGDNISLSLLLSNDDVMVLAVNKQQIQRQEQSLKLTACIVNGYQSDTFSLTEAKQLAMQIKAAIPGLYGFVGVDLIITDDAAVVIDINPRLTSSYIGLHASLGSNPMALLIKLYEEGLTALPAIKQRRTVSVNT